MLFLLGIGLFAVGGIVHLLERDHRRRAWCLLAKGNLTASTEGLVRLEGTIVPGPLGTLRAPLSGREVVWFRIRVEERRGRRETVVLLEESEGHPFLLEDGQGQARIEPDGATFLVDRETVAGSGLWSQPTVEFERYLASRGHAMADEPGLLRQLTCREECLHPGDRLIASGVAQRRAVASATAGDYRAPGTERVLARSLEGTNELLLTNRSRGALTLRLVGPSLAGLGLCVLGVVLLLIAIGQPAHFFL